MIIPDIIGIFDIRDYIPMQESNDFSNVKDGIYLIEASGSFFVEIDSGKATELKGIFPSSDYLRYAREKFMNETFETKLTNLINEYSLENGTNTPDFILAQYILGCLEVFTDTMKRRENWYWKDGEKDSDE